MPRRVYRSIAIYPPRHKGASEDTNGCTCSNLKHSKPDTGRHDLTARPPQALPHVPCHANALSSLETASGASCWAFRFCMVVLYWYWYSVRCAWRYRTSGTAPSSTHTFTDIGDTAQTTARRRTLADTRRHSPGTRKARHHRAVTAVTRATGDPPPHVRREARLDLCARTERIPDPIVQPRSVALVTCHASSASRKPVS